LSEQANNRNDMGIIDAMLSATRQLAALISFLLLNPIPSDTADRRLYIWEEKGAPMSIGNSTRGSAGIGIQPNGRILVFDSLTELLGAMRELDVALPKVPQGH
jgi:hypothetical protein